MNKYLAYLITSVVFFFLLASTTKLGNITLIFVSALCGIGVTNIAQAFQKYFRNR